MREADEGGQYVAAEEVAEEPQEGEVVSALVEEVVLEVEASQEAEVADSLLEAEEVPEAASLVDVDNWTCCTFCSMRSGVFRFACSVLATKGGYQVSINQKSQCFDFLPIGVMVSGNLVKMTSLNDESILASVIY